MDEKYRESRAPIPSNTSRTMSPSPTGSCRRSRIRFKRPIPASYSVSPGPKADIFPTHNPNYRLPQGPDPVWNNANCRTRRLFGDRAVQKVAANTKPVSAANLPAGHGRRHFVLMKDLSSPIRVGGRHWGAFRMGFSAIPEHKLSLRALAKQSISTRKERMDCFVAYAPRNDDF